MKRMISTSLPWILKTLSLWASIGCARGESVTTRFFLVRSAERIDFAEKDWSSSAHNPYDPYLSRLGSAQAAQLGHHLNPRRITRVYSSPFLRALQTAQGAAESLDQIFSIAPEPGLCEFLYGGGVP
uniref:Uncharacterized protein n=1 Tax=Cryptomonas curvata TaxID=233186 RepID=A0A7S0MBY0_9CRYP